MSCWTPRSPTQLLHEVCKRREWFRPPKSPFRGHQLAVAMLLDRCCSIPVPSVFPYTGAGCQAAWDESWGVLCCSPLLLASSQTGTFLPCSHTGTFTKKRKNAQSPLQSVLWPAVNLPHPSCPLSCQPLLPSAAALCLLQPQSVSGLKFFHAAQVSGSRTEPFPLEPWWCSSGSHGFPWCRHFPGSDSHGLPWAVFLVCWAKNKSPKCWVP